MTRKSAAGRRPGDSRTREAILDAATTAFLEQGYAAATMRGMARSAGVDPSLVVHFFGSKDGLFRAVLEHGASPMATLATFADGPVGELGGRLIDRYLEIWERPDSGPRMHAVLRAVASSETAARLLTSFISEAVLTPLAGRIPGEEGRLRGALCGSHLAGLAIARYVLRVEPLASLPRERLTAIVGPALQAYLTGDLG